MHLHSSICKVAAVFQQRGSKRHAVFPGYILVLDVKCLGGFFFFPESLLHSCTGLGKKEITKNLVLTLEACNLLKSHRQMKLSNDTELNISKV